MVYNSIYICHNVCMKSRCMLFECWTLTGCHLIRAWRHGSNTFIWAQTAPPDKGVFVQLDKKQQKQWDRGATPSPEPCRVLSNRFWRSGGGEGGGALLLHSTEVSGGGVEEERRGREERSWGVEEERSWGGEEERSWGGVSGASRRAATQVNQ